MTASLEIAVHREHKDARSLTGSVTEAMGIAYITLLIFDLCRDRTEALTWLRAAMGGASGGEGPGTRVLHFAQALLPEDVLKQVAPILD
jgi:hypothetical protein